MSEARIGRVGQIKVYTGKCFRTFFNEKGWKNLISTLIIALLLVFVIGNGVFTERDATEFGLFAMICGCIWTGLFNSIQAICRERAIIKREHRTGLHISSYVIAHMVFDLVLCAAEALIITAVFSTRGFGEADVVFFAPVDFFIGFLLVIYASDTLGLLVSCVVKTENAAMTVMPFVLIIQLVMCGVIFTLPDSASWVEDITISKWGLNALCSSADAGNMPSERAMFNYGKELYYDGEIDQEDFPDYLEYMDLYKKYQADELDDDDIEELEGLEEEYDLEMPTNEDYEGTTENVLGAWGMMIFFSLLYGGIGTLFLKRVDKDKR